MSDSNTSYPPIAWAQRKDVLFITILLEDIKDKVLHCTDDKLSFKGSGGEPRKTFAFDIEFYKKVNQESVKENLSGKQLFITIKKAESGPFWPRLLKDSKKVQWLKTDFEKWRDEDDSDVDETIPVDNDFESQMASLGNYGDGDDNEPPADNDDSDDDALPDLE